MLESHKKESGGSLVASLLTFYSDHSSSNPTEMYRLSLLKGKNNLTNLYNERGTIKTQLKQNVKCLMTTKISSYSKFVLLSTGSIFREQKWRIIRRYRIWRPQRLRRWPHWGLVDHWPLSWRIGQHRHLLIACLLLPPVIIVSAEVAINCGKILMKV